MPRDCEDMIIATGPGPGSRKIYETGGSKGDLHVPFREVALEASAKEPPVRLYDTSGPYTDGDAKIDVYAGLPRMREGWRSEEHTSELQSLMRISYAVFCLKKKINNNYDNTKLQYKQ